MTLETALALVAELQAQNARLQAENAALAGRVAELEAGTRQPPPWVKANRKPREPAARPRRRRAADQNQGRPRGEPTAYVRHAYDQCPACGYPLQGEAVGRRREVLELPAVAVSVTEHQLLRRYCPVCAAYQTPRVSFAGVVLGQGRIGVRLASLIGALRTS